MPSMCKPLLRIEVNIEELILLVTAVRMSGSHFLGCTENNGCSQLMGSRSSSRLH